MASIITDLKERFYRGTICTQLIYINIGLFLLITLSEGILRLFNRSLGIVLQW